MFHRVRQTVLRGQLKSTVNVASQPQIFIDLEAGDFSTAAGHVPEADGI